MAKYLIDVNLPYRFELWKGADYIHQRDIDDEWKDEKIWKYAEEHNLTIISKDSDFSNKILLHTPPPKVIHVNVGNLKIRELYVTLHAIWIDVLKMSETHKLVNIFIDRIEGIN